MTAYSVLEVCIVTLVVLFCSYQAFRRLMPKVHARARRALGAGLVARGGTGWTRRVGERWMGAQANGGCGDDSGCSACGSCGTDAAPPAPSTKEVKLVRRESM